jgi:hypothetical protein
MPSSDFKVTREGLLLLESGGQVDLTTAEGAADVVSGLDAASMDELVGLMGAQGYRYNGSHFVADDRYSVGAGNYAAGPTSTTNGMTDVDEDIGAMFQRLVGANPYNANTTPALHKTLIEQMVFQGAVKATQNYLANPTNQNMVAAAQSTSELMGPGVNAMEILYLVFRESIRDINEDKKYFLKKLQDYNKMGEQLSKYLSTLIEASNRLADAERGQEEPQKVYIDVEVKEFDTATLDPNGEMITTKDESRGMNRYALNDRIKYVETQQEDVRNRRQMATTSFQNFDQKSNQLLNMLSSIIKTMNEMRSIGAGSRSGL